MLLIGLRACRAIVPDIITNLFEAYKNCGDSKFVSCMEKKEEECKDRTLANLTTAQLMKLAIEKCENLEGRDKWMKKSGQQLEFVAMKAEWEQLKKQKLVLTQKQARSGKSSKDGGGNHPPRQNVG